MGATYNLNRQAIQIVFVIQNIFTMYEYDYKSSKAFLNVIPTLSECHLNFVHYQPFNFYKRNKPHHGSNDNISSSKWTRKLV